MCGCVPGITPFMLSTSLERSALGRIWKPAPFPLCCIKAPDLSAILIFLPFLFPPPSLQPIIYGSGKDFPHPPFFSHQIFSKINDQKQLQAEVKIQVTLMFHQEPPLFRSLHCAKFGSVHMVVLCLSPGDPSIWVHLNAKYVCLGVFTLKCIFH